MQYFVYIGRDSKTIELLSRLSIGVFYAAPNCSKAVKVLDKIREKYDAALFFEQVEHIQRYCRYPIHAQESIRGFIWYSLSTPCLRKKHHEYLKAGINNTIKFEMSS